VDGRYGSQTLDLGLFSLMVDWATTRSPSGYVWSSSTGHRSRSDLRFESSAKAKASAEQWARKAMRKALALLPVPIKPAV
jgi:hypothetical protein